MEDAFSKPTSATDISTQPSGDLSRAPCPSLKKEGLSIFEVATAIQMEKPQRKAAAAAKRKEAFLDSPVTATKNAASPKALRPSPKACMDLRDMSFQLDGNVSMEHTFQMKAQIDAYRRVIRGDKVPMEVLVASKGRSLKDTRPLHGSVVQRGVARADDRDRSSYASLVPPKYSQFDVRILPRRPFDHVFTKLDVVAEGEKLTEIEVAERVLLAQVHHERLHARYFDEIRSTRGPRMRELNQIDPRILQQRSELIDLACVGSMPRPAAEGGANSESLRALERLILMKKDKLPALADASVVRDRAAVPISVETKGKLAPSYQDLLIEREKVVVRRVQARIRELSDLPAALPQDVKHKALMDERRLKLIPLQRSVRAQVRQIMTRLLDRPGPFDLRRHGRGVLKTPALSNAYRNALPNGSRVGQLRPNMSIRSEQQLRRRERRVQMMGLLFTHTQNFRSASHARSVLHKRLLKDLDKYFREKSREEERRRKKEQMERLRALRDNNEDEYLELLKTTKNKRLIQLLKQTDEYLMQIGAQVERQKQAARNEETESGSRIVAHQAPAKVDEPSDSKIETPEGDDELQQLKKRRNDYYTITHTISEKVHQPKCLVGGLLKPYQIEGLQWLVSLYNNNLNGILADEMGLGKTIQTLSLITYLFEVKRLHGPFLVIVPLSVMSNWVRELDHWAPSLTKVVYKGDPSKRRNIQVNQMGSGSYNVLLTTYEFIVRDKNVLGKINWKYIIMDEGHRMKNADCKLALTLGAKYKSRNRLLLTGTPLQNNMTELWALLNFLLPSIFSSAETFETWFNAPFQASSLGDSPELNEEENLLIISRLHQVLRPFMLRRLKTDVETQLPDKVENVFRCEMSIWQRVLYRQVRGRIGIGAGSGNVGIRSFNNMVMQLKKVCNHPYLFYSEEELMSIPRDYLVRASGKFELLEHCLKKLKRTEHRVLVFSQMTAALDYLEYFLNMIGMKHLRLDGTTKSDDRQEMLELFNAKDSEYFCFLLSTRAGGLGLNLQTADTVIIFDSDWNPMMDLQAQDRAHRIGQTKEVRVFRLICAGSIEVKILERANRKLQIDAQVIQAGQFNNKSSDTDRQTMLKDLLRQQGEDELAAHSDVTQLSEINKKLARSDEEFDTFEEMDVELANERGGKPRLLMNEADLPSWVLKPEVEHNQKKVVEEINFMEHGRGRRKRKEVLYDDNLTEREWTTAMEEEGDVTEAIKRKRRRLNPQNRAAELSSGDDIDTTKDSPEQEFNVGKGVEIEESSKIETEDEERSVIHAETSITKMAPFLDPELNETPRRRRKRGRPRRDSFA